MFKIIKEADFKKTVWSGGISTELFIYPEDSSYLKRDFRIRVSSAHVALENSVFTLLPGVKRFIAPLETPFRLLHKTPSGGVKVELGKYEVDFFDGGQETLCQGGGRDLNLMLKNASGSMRLVRNEEISFGGGFLFIYALERTQILFSRAPVLDLGARGFAMTRQKGSFSVKGLCFAMTAKLD